VRERGGERRGESEPGDDGTAGDGGVAPSLEPTGRAATIPTRLPPHVALPSLALPSLAFPLAHGYAGPGDLGALSGLAVPARG